MNAVPNTEPDDLVIAINYAADGTWADMFDNSILAWTIDDAGATAEPAIVGTLPPAVDTTPVASPQWVLVHGNSVLVPDLWRGQIDDFFTWLATNNGATRQIRGNFLEATPLNAFAAWAQDNPTLVWAGP